MHALFCYNISMIKNRTLIFPDQHHKVLWIEDFLKSQTYTELVFLGDYFDAFNDTVTDAQRTAYWLKYALEDYPDAHFLLGNHDIAYRFPTNHYLWCSGNTKAKSESINKILTQEDWAKFKLCHYTQGFLCSHAGITKHLYSVAPAVEDIENLCQDALEKASKVICTPILDVGRSRGGGRPFGGITWGDWREFEPIEGINQIVGHTPNFYVRSNSIPDSQNYCIDTQAAHVGVIEDGKFSYIESTCPQKGKSTI